MSCFFLAVRLPADGTQNTQNTQNTPKGLSPLEKKSVCFVYSVYFVTCAGRRIQPKRRLDFSQKETYLLEEHSVEQKSCCHKKFCCSSFLHYFGVLFRLFDYVESNVH